MKNSFITVVAIVLVAGLVFFVPLMTMADRFDNTSKAEVEAIVSDFVEEVRTTRKITETKYNQFLQNLNSLGYKFDVEMEVKNLDENPGKKTSQTAKDKIGENVYYSEYTSQIEEELEKKGVKNLNTGDIVLVEVRNANPTLAQQLQNWVYKIVGNDSATVIASKAGMVQ